MKEGVVILAVILVLLGLTAIRYRRQIAASIHIYRQLRGLGSELKSPRSPTSMDPKRAESMICCEKCRKWVPETESVAFGRGAFFCSVECFNRSAASGSRT